MESRQRPRVFSVIKTVTLFGRAQRPAILFAGLLVSVFLTYSPALKGAFLWDDNAHVTDNAALYQHPRNLLKIWTEPRLTQQYYPLTFTVFAVEYQTWKNWTPGYHVVNILLHALDAYLFASLLMLLEIPGAWFAAFLFALHPVCVESVAWISELKNVLSTAFFLGAAVWFWRFEERRQKKDYATSFALYLAALLSKTVTCTFPGVMLVLVWWKKGRLTLREAMLQVPFIVIGLGLGLETAYLERSSIGAHGAGWMLSPWQHLLLAARIVCFYFGKMVWPHPLIFFYPRWSMTEHALWIYPAVLVGVVGFCTWFALNGKRSRLAVVLLFMGMLVPALGFTNVYPMRYSYVADHFQYLACLPVLALIAAWLSTRRPIRSNAWTLCLGAGCAGLALISHSQAATYRSSSVLWQQTALKNPDSPVVLTNWATELMKQGKTVDAVVVLRRALVLDPNSVEAMENLAEILHDAGQFKQSIDWHQKAIAIEPTWPALHYRTADVYKDSGDLDRAGLEYENVIRLLPSATAPVPPYAQRRALRSMEAHARDHLAERFASHQQFSLSEDELNKALTIDPAAAPLHWHRALILKQEGKVDESIEEYRKALAIDGSSAEVHYSFAEVLWQAHRAPEAKLEFSAANKLDARFIMPTDVSHSR